MDNSDSPTMRESTLAPRIGRRRLQFSVKGILLLTLIAGVIVSPLSLRLYRKRQQRAAVTMLEGFGALVWYDWQLTPDARPRGPEWARKLCGDDIFADVAVVSFAYGGGFNMTDAGLARLRPLTNLRSLMLRHANLTDGGLIQLCSFRRLVKLDLSYAPIRGPGLTELGSLPALRELSLEGTVIDDAALRFLRDCTSLEQLSLSGTNIRGTGLTLLRDLPNLAELDLSTEVTAEGLKSLSALKHLRILWLEGNSVDDQVLRVVSEAKGLRVLALSSNNITDAGMKYLLRLPKLKQLSLQGDRITEEGMAALAQIRTLQYLYLFGRGISRAAQERLQVHLPNCEIRPLARWSEPELWTPQREEILREKD